MFKSMRLKNFKAYKDSGEVPLAPLTVIIGANNSGKSTLFHALLALAQTAQDAEQAPGLLAKRPPLLVTKGPLVDLNGFYDIVHGKKKVKASSFEISVAIGTPTRVSLTGTPLGRIDDLDIPDQFDISFALSKKTNAIEVNRST